MRKHNSAPKQDWLPLQSCFLLWIPFSFSARRVYDNVMTRIIRYLSAQEQSVVSDVITTCIDLNEIEIHKKRWTPLTPKNVTVVRGHKIFYPGDPGPIENPYHLAHLVHEIVHVWQYKHIGIGLYSARWLDRRYRYSLLPGDKLSDFGLEQQACIFEDHFRLSRGLNRRWAINEPSQMDLAGCIESVRPHEHSDEHIV